MRLMTLNAWSGKLYTPLRSLIDEYKDEVDIFCFQDLLFGSDADFTPKRGGRINIFKELCDQLPEHAPIEYRDPEESHFHGELLPKSIGCGLAMFVHRNIEVIESGGFNTHPHIAYEEHPKMVSGKCQYAVLKIGTTPYCIMNIHGLWEKGSSKEDSEDRILQSQMIVDFIKRKNMRCIIAGDFNLLLESDSVKLLERNNLINLIRAYDISSTRTHLYEKPVKHADYIFTSKDVSLIDFQALPHVASDHTPLLLTFT